MTSGNFLGTPELVIVLSFSVSDAEKRMGTCPPGHTNEAVFVLSWYREWGNCAQRKLGGGGERRKKKLSGAGGSALLLVLP